jgi:hypothetical protein
MTWLKDIFSKLLPKKHDSSLKLGLAFNETYQAFGVFEYFNDGFTLTNEDFSGKIKWDDIVQINVFKRDQLTIDRIEMEIVIEGKSFTISEDLSGWNQFVLKTKEVYSTIPKDWDLDIIQPPFEVNIRNIYDQEKLSKNKQQL